ncbi:retrovirus-related pol polyprotein from transposon RE1, partial [Tanacetum coccineum]
GDGVVCGFGGKSGWEVVGRLGMLGPLTSFLLCRADPAFDFWQFLHSYYEETFDPVAKMTIVETLISVVFSYQCNISQMDIKNAFLNGDLNEEVYMAPPPSVPRQLGEVSELSYQFSMNDMVLLRYFLGFEVASLHRDYLFTQSKYIANLFDRFRMTCNKLIVDILLDSRAKYTRIDLILVAFSCQCNISQIDVKNAFSNGDLNEEVYMTPPPNVPLQLGKVYVYAYCDAEWAGDSITLEYRAMIVTTGEIRTLHCEFEEGWLVSVGKTRLIQNDFSHGKINGKPRGQGPFSTDFTRNYSDGKTLVGKYFPTDFPTGR